MRSTRTAAELMRWTAITYAWTVCCAWLFAGRAQAIDPNLWQIDWQAPTECPDRAELESRVLARLGQRPANQRLRASGRIESSATGYGLWLRTEQGERKLGAGDCDQLTSAAALILALSIDQAGSAPQAALPTSNARAIWLLIRPELVADLGTLPALAVGPGLSLGVRVLATSLEISGGYLPIQHIEPSDRLSPIAKLSVWAAALGACQALTAAPELSPCLRVEYGRLSAEGEDIPNARRAAGAWLLALAGVRLSAALTKQLHANLDLALGLPVLGAALTVNTVGTVYETGNVVGRLRAGLELRL